MILPKLIIGDLVAKVPIVQGGMGVGISLSSLAGHVALCGGVGVISGVEIGFNESDYFKDKRGANLKALRYHIERAREIACGGILGVNLMVALNNFEEMVRETVKQKVDIIFAGAGLPLNLPKFTKGSSTKAVPIVSSGRAAGILCKSWTKRYGVCPDAVIVEGPLAGGHLGFTKEQISDDSYRLENLLKEVLEVVRPYGESCGKRIPVIAAGGIFDGSDIAELIEMGADGVQMGTRFVATHECDASDEFKAAYLKAEPEDAQIIQSPLGMIGRAIKNDFIDEAIKGNKRPTKCITNCLKPCNPRKALYCIADALINAQRGIMKEGFAFAGANVPRVKEIVTVRELIDELVDGAQNRLAGKREVLD